MLDLVNCQVLSIIESRNVDAYLLSESSMFVFPHKLVLKTCGTTTLLCGLPRMLELAALEVGFRAFQLLPRLTASSTAARTSCTRTSSVDRTVAGAMRFASSMRDSAAAVPI
jgi:S-adenosylmethionine decarboxylase